MNAEPSKKKFFIGGIPTLHPHAAGIDIGDTFHAVAIMNEKGEFETREYLSFTEDLSALVAWLREAGINTVAMESTGVYWLNLYLMLEEAGIESYLVNAKHVKNVSGRKKDDTDAIWLQRLHSCGLLQRCFQPKDRTIRTYIRQRRKLILLESDHVRRMQKALELMNIKLHVVISDLLGKTGLSIVEAILAGEHDPKELIKFKDPRIRKSTDEEILKALEGIWKEEYLFLLNQAYEGYLFYKSQIEACEQKIHEELTRQIAKLQEGDITEITDIPEKKKKKRPQKNQLDFDAGTLLEKWTGVDLCAIPGIGPTTALELIAEIGTDMNHWKSAKHFSAWLNLVPNTKITGGNIISSKMQKKKNYAGLSLRMAASTLYRNKSPLGDYYRKMRSRLGKKGGVVATANKMARIIYTMLKTKQAYDESLLNENNVKWKEQRLKYLEKQLQILKKAS